jgi:hypothetical protein
MNWQQFELRFPKKIGEDPLDQRDEFHTYHVNDNGDVGVWITNTRTTVGDGRQLFGEDAEACLHHCKQKTWAERVKRQEQGRER